MNGFDIIEALGEHEATNAIPIMVLIAKHATEADTDHSMARCRPSSGADRPEPSTCSDSCR